MGFNSEDRKFGQASGDELYPSGASTDTDKQRQCKACCEGNYWVRVVPASFFPLFSDVVYGFPSVVRVIEFDDCVARRDVV